MHDIGFHYKLVGATRYNLQELGQGKCNHREMPTKARGVGKLMELITQDLNDANSSGRRMRTNDGVN